MRDASEIMSGLYQWRDAMWNPESGYPVEVPIGTDEWLTIKNALAPYMIFDPGCTESKFADMKVIQVSDGEDARARLLEKAI